MEPDSASLRMARQLALAVLTEIRIPKIPPTTVVHSPKPWFCCSQAASHRKKQGGSRMESPNWVTQSIRLSVLIADSSLNKSGEIRISKIFYIIAKNKQIFKNTVLKY